MKRLLLLAALFLATPVPAEEIVSAGQPDAAAIERYAEAGVRTVIDLRGDDEDRGFDEASAVEAAGMRYVRLPIVGQDAVSFDNAERLDSLLEESPGPVVVHCGSGNRVGALLALRASRNGADADAALATGRQYGLTRLAPLVEQRLQAADNEADSDGQNSNE